MLSIEGEVSLFFLPVVNNVLFSLSLSKALSLILFFSAFFPSYGILACFLGLKGARSLLVVIWHFVLFFFPSGTVEYSEVHTTKNLKNGNLWLYFYFFPRELCRGETADGCVSDCGGRQLHREMVLGAENRPMLKN